MSTASRFTEFGNNIKLTSVQYDHAKTKYDNVCRVLHNRYYPNTAYDGTTKFLIGSYGKETAIRPPRDIDVIFKMPWDQFNRKMLVGNGPRFLLNEIKGILQKTFTTTESIRPNGMVVEVNFTTFSIEVLPGFEWDTVEPKGQFYVPQISKPSPIGLIQSIFVKHWTIWCDK